MCAALAWNKNYNALRNGNCRVRAEKCALRCRVSLLCARDARLCYGSIVQTGFVYKRRVRHAVGKFSAATIYLCIFIYSLKTVLNYKNISDT